MGEVPQEGQGETGETSGSGTNGRERSVLSTKTFVRDVKWTETYGGPGQGPSVGSRALGKNNHFPARESPVTTVIGRDPHTHS